MITYMNNTGQLPLDILQQTENSLEHLMKRRAGTRIKYRAG